MLKRKLNFHYLSIKVFNIVHGVQMVYAFFYKGEETELIISTHCI